MMLTKSRWPALLPALALVLCLGAVSGLVAQSPEAKHPDASAVRRLRTPAEKVDPVLVERLADAGGAPVDVDVWLAFDPDDVDHVESLARALRSGVSRRRALEDLRNLVAAGNLRVTLPARALCDAVGVRVRHVDRYAPLICVTAGAGEVAQLAEHALVARLFAAHESHTSLQSAQATHRWDRVHGHGVRGDGARLAIVEGGTIDTASGVNVVGIHIPGQPIASHGTQAASVAASDSASRPGYARGVEVLNANTANGGLGAVAAATGWALGQGAGVLSHSANIDAATLTLTAWDYYFDYVVRYLRATYCVPTSNAGQGSGAVKSPGLAWNVITCGAVDDAGTGDWDDDFMAPYSSWHDPLSTHGDREKPELVAVGSGLSVAGVGGAFQTISGTSFSTPTVAGMAACLQQAEPSFTAWPEPLKAVLMASATHNVEGASRLSDKDGAGCINGLQALRVAEQRQFEFGTLYPTSFNTNGYSTRQVHLEAGDLTRVVLCWNSDADAAMTMDVLDADLDLRVFQGQGTGGPLVASSASWDNSYEIVEFCPSASGWYTVAVSAFRFDGASETYGIAWTQDADGRYVRFRPRYPDVLATDETGPSIGNGSFLLAPSDPVNPNHGYVGIASGATAPGLPFPGCRYAPIAFDAVSDVSIMAGNPFFLDFIGTLNGSGEAPTMRLAVPDAAFLAGVPLHYGLVTLDAAAPGGVKEVAEVKTLRFWDHAVDLQLGDDDFVAVNLGFSFPFFGQSYTVAYVNSNGNLTFTSGDTAWNESLPTFLNGGPRIAPFWDDLNPTAGGRVQARFAGDAFVVEWIDVPQFGTTDQNSGIVVLHQSGVVEFLYRDCGLNDALVGITAGGGVTGYPVDLSHGSRYPDPLLYIGPPAIHEHFTGSGSAVFDLGVASDARNRVTFTPTGLALGNYRVTFDGQP